ncbi:MAG: MgtC/SapB family protein [Bryobacteraceae bacterium]
MFAAKLQLSEIPLIYSPAWKNLPELICIWRIMQRVIYSSRGRKHSVTVAARKRVDFAEPRASEGGPSRCLPLAHGLRFCERSSNAIDLPCGGVAKSPELGWQEIALRLALAALAGVLFGMDRSERGRAAGLRTTLLISLAEAVAMIQANLLLRTAGKTADSFVVAESCDCRPAFCPVLALSEPAPSGGGAIRCWA